MRVKVTGRGQCAGLCAQQGHQGLSVQPSACYSLGFAEEETGAHTEGRRSPPPPPPSLIVRFKVNLKRLAAANQNTHLRCDDPLSL